MNHFVATMPAAYERLYAPSEMTEHAEIASRRAGRLVHAELWQSTQGPSLCVVADDRPGLLALVTDALLAQGMGIQSARAFCRVVGQDKDEAVDFLELRTLGGSEDIAAQLDLSAFAQSLSDLLGDDAAHRAASAPAAPNEATAGTRVYFERQAPAEGRYLLVVDAPDSDGLLHAVSAALHAKSMRIMACEIRTVGGRARDRFEVEPSSQRALGDAELCDVQLAVLDALPSRR
ncbi:MAG: [Protein-PII] uridylyltransferase [Polyangiaceae bacterium]|nr:[Protein-PII] uridylyltransferase [Polyangiaceae bacterium]